MKKAIFLDRDGVINPPVLDKRTKECEPPVTLRDYQLYPWTADSLKKLQRSGFELFIISNQPGYAKGNVRVLQDLIDIGVFAETLLSVEGVKITASYYCYHHPNGVVPSFAIKCDCRKPNALFIYEAAKDYDIDLESSWMIGDRDTDIECGERAGTKTILLETEESADRRGESIPTYTALNLGIAANMILTSLLRAQAAQ